MDVVVIEHGVAWLRRLSERARMRALAEVASPAFREHLADEPLSGRRGDAG